MKTRTLVVIVAVASLAAACLAPAAHAATTTTEKEYGEPSDDKALAYFIRTKRFTGSGRTLFLYAGDRFLVALENDSYTFAHVEPGEQFLWLNWARVNRSLEKACGNQNCGSDLADCSSLLCRGVSGGTVR